MNEFADSGELFTVRNQFYTGQHQKVIAYKLESFSPANQLRVLAFQVRSCVAISKDASQLIVEGKAKFPDDGQLFDVLQAWDDLAAFRTDESTYFDDVAEPQFETQAVLTALYLVKLHGDIDGAIALLEKYSASTARVLELEPYLLLVQLYLVKENFAEATRVFSRFQQLPFEARDDIVYHVVESWVNSVKGQSDNISNAYYFYDELLSGDFDDDAQGKFHILNVLFVMTLQLKHYPEAQELLDQIAALDFDSSSNADLIANRITYEYLTNDGANVVSLLRELANADSEHQMLKDFKEKNERFDAIVEKYQTA